MMVILLFDVKNLIRKIIIILMMMKTAVAIKTLLIIKIMSPRQCHHKTQKKLCSYLEIACNEIKCFFYWQKKNSIINALSRYNHLVQWKSDVCMIMWSQLYEILIWTILSFIVGLMIWVLREQPVRLPDLLKNLHFHYRIIKYQYPYWTKEWHLQ